MSHYCGYNVIDLYREQISDLTLGSLSLPEGQYIEINKTDILKVDT
jgi:16S rRNA pseudouridine516 synthase